MPEAVHIEFRGLDELERKLGKIKSHSFLQGLLVAAANQLVTWTAPYPPAPPYGVTNRWWERGRGGFWRTKDGIIHGPKPLSEDLNKRWGVQTHGELSVIVRNDASYAGWVHDKDRQAGFHAARGWRTIQDEWEKGKSELEKSMADEVERVWGGG